MAKLAENAKPQAAGKPQTVQAARAAAWTALTAGLLAAVTAGLLADNYLRLRQADPANDPALAQLKAELGKAKDPAARENLAGQIRRLDQQLRQEYFDLHHRGQLGLYLLAGLAAVCLVSLHYAWTSRQKPPAQQRPHDARPGWMSRIAVTALAALLLMTGAAYPLLRRGVVGSVADGQPGNNAASDKPGPTGDGREWWHQQRRHWPRFRGADGSGVVSFANIPTEWGGPSGKNILWKTPIPMNGHNSPITWGDKVFLTGADKTMRVVFCLSAKSGEILWEQAVQTAVGVAQNPPKVMEEDTGYAAPTAVTDGKCVCAIFANGDLACFDLDGKQLWAENYGPLENNYGHSSSLAMYAGPAGSLLFVQLDQGSAADEGISRLLALHADSGKLAWQVRRPVAGSWTSPIVIDLGPGRPAQLIVAGNPWAIGYDALSGKELWRAEVLNTDCAPSPIFAGGVVYTVNTSAQLAAIKPDGTGTLAKLDADGRLHGGPHLLWTADDGLPDIVSPLSDGKRVLLTRTNGTLTCFAAESGKKLWEQSLEDGFKASPSLVGERLYMLSDKGVMVVADWADGYKEIGRCGIGEEAAASPAFADGRIYIRGAKNLYCVGGK